MASAEDGGLVRRIPVAPRSSDRAASAAEAIGQLGGGARAAATESCGRSRAAPWLPDREPLQGSSLATRPEPFAKGVDVFSLYYIFKFIHILAAMLWLGGAVTLTVINGRAARAKDLASLGQLARHTEFYGRAVLGPAAGMTLVAGIVTMVAGKLPPTLWIMWGLLMVVGSLVVGGGLIGRTAGQLARLVAQSPDHPRVAALGRRMGILSWVNILMLVTAVAAMVFKPSF